VVGPQALVGGCLGALVALLRVAFSFATIGMSGQLNDFYDYWAAGVLLNRGENPYNVGALTAVQHAAGVQVETGSGYSYPLFFARSPPRKTRSGISLRSCSRSGLCSPGWPDGGGCWRSACWAGS
jgi:hypothetical protein